MKHQENENFDKVFFQFVDQLDANSQPAEAAL